MSNLFQKPDVPVVAPPPQPDILKQGQDQAKLNNISLEQSLADQQKFGAFAQFTKSPNQGVNLH